MKKMTRRALSLLLTAAMACSLLSASVMAAPGAGDSFETVAKDANLALGMSGTASAAAAGRSVELSAPLPEEYDAAAGPVMLLVKAQDGSESALRFIRAEKSGENAVATVQQNGAARFAYAAAQLPLDQGGIEDFTVDYNAAKQTISYSGELAITSDLAILCYEGHTETERLAGLRFTCYLDDALIRTLTSVDGDDIRLTGATFNGVPVFTLNDAGVDAESGAWAEYRLSDEALEAFKSFTGSATEFVSALHGRMTMTCSGQVDRDRLRSALNADSELWSYARMEISYTGGAVPRIGAKYVVVPSAMGVSKIRIDSGSSSSGSTSDSVTITIKDGAHTETKITTPDGKEHSGSGAVTVKPGDKIIVRTQDTAANERIRTVRVTDASGATVPVTEEDSGAYSFIVPHSRSVSVTPVVTSAVYDPDETGVSAMLETEQHNAFMQGYTDGSFRPGRNISRAEVAVIFSRLLKDHPAKVVDPHYEDVPENAWYKDAVDELSTLGVIRGVGDGTNFAPNAPITRAQFVAMAVRFTDATVAGRTFSDVPAGYWAEAYIRTAAYYGWVTGFEDGTFGPTRNITRAQAAAIFNRMLCRLADANAIDAGAFRTFTDVNSGYWAWYDIAEATYTHGFTMSADKTQETWK